MPKYRSTSGAKDVDASNNDIIVNACTMFVYIEGNVQGQKSGNRSSVEAVSRSKKQEGWRGSSGGVRV